MREVEKTDLESMVLNAMDSFFNVDKSFISLDITNFIFENITEEVLHHDVANVVRRLFVNGHMEKNDYFGTPIVVRLNNNKTYTTTSYYSSNNIFINDIILNVNLTPKKKNHVCKCESKCKKSEFIKYGDFQILNESESLKKSKEIFEEAIKEIPAYIVIKSINSDGRLEVPQELLLKSEWLDNNSYISFIPMTKNSFAMADCEDDKAIDFNFVVKNNRVKIPKTVFNMLNLPTTYGTQYEISYVEETDMLVVKLLKK